ncbi:hypothetical protein LY76DRAFT_311600 [Colletotrichum caudatum]|nr:hypothetical protein LY76DRAFT_311600 [Colletotrichum caudatum]
MSVLPKWQFRFWDNSTASMPTAAHLCDPPGIADALYISFFLISPFLFSFFFLALMFSRQTTLGLGLRKSFTRTTAYESRLFLNAPKIHLSHLVVNLGKMRGWSDRLDDDGGNA